MKTLTLILMLFAITAMAQNPIVYVCKFQKQSKAEQVIAQLDSLYIEVANPRARIISYRQNFLSKDSTAIYEDGYFYNVITYVEFPVLLEYVIYPCKMKQRWGVDESAYKHKE